MGSIVYRKTLVNLIKQECGEPSLGVEVGVHRGGLSKVLLREFPKLILVMVDLWEDWPDIWDTTTPDTLKQQKKHRWVAMRRTKFAKSRRKIISKDSVKAAELFQKKQIDFVFIDADHSYEGCLRDMKAWWPLTKSLFCGHDYGKSQFGVDEAVADFCKEYEVRMNTARGHMWWISKK